MTAFLRRVYERAALCRAFEEECYRRIESGQIKCPTYLSAGQEYIPATIATWIEDRPELAGRKVFIQHRGHSQYLCFGGDMRELVFELLGDRRGCAGGMGGSASIHSPAAGIFGHDGLMGSQVPIAVGYCYATRTPTIVFAGDAAIEEDYALASLGWAATHRLPILFVVEDNGLSILTEKRVRRSWSIVQAARGFDMLAAPTLDDPQELAECMDIKAIFRDGPMLLNVTTHRLYWHAGAGRDGEGFDRHKAVAAGLPPDFVARTDAAAAQCVAEAWEAAEVPA